MEQSGSDELLFLLSVLLIPLCLPQFAATCSLPDMCHGQLGVLCVWVAICVCNQDPQLPYAISALLEHTINTWGGPWLHCSKPQFAFSNSLFAPANDQLVRALPK